MQLNWPYEGATPLPEGAPRFAHAGSNICLDFHGDPGAARLVVFSDGNHHMALADALAAFRERHPAVQDVFYVTTPPRVVEEALGAGFITVGNLRLSAAPHVFIGPAPLVERLARDGRLAPPRPLAASRAIALLVRKGNPRGITGLGDLAREGMRLFLSNPVTEATSYRIYTTALRLLARRNGLDTGFLDDVPGALPRVVHGERIHHREAPQCLADDRADAAVVFHHLALRYTRVFSETFDSIPLALEADGDAHIARTAISRVGDGGEWGDRLVEFMGSDEVARIYHEHGLDPAR